MSKKEIKVTKRVDLTQEMADDLGKIVGNFYDNAMVEMLKGASLFYTGKFRKKRVPKYLWITVPTIEYHICDWGECGCSVSGLLISTKRIKLFKIGTEVIEVPVRRKFKKGEKITFRRYGNLKKTKSKKTRQAKGKGKV